MLPDENVSKFKELMFDCQKIRNVALYDRRTEECIAFSRYLILEDESSYGFDERVRCVKRRFTLKSKIQGYHDEEYLLNVIDPPNISYFGPFAHSLHPVDGIVISAYSSDNLERILGHVLSQAIKPILFINDIDDLCRRLDYDVAAIMDEISRIVSNFNEIIGIYADIDKVEEWQVDITNGSVIFGSIEFNFACDLPSMVESGIGFEGMVECFENRETNFMSDFPLHRVLAKSIIEHLPSPDVAQAYRIPKLLDVAGGFNEAKSMMNPSSEGPSISWIIYDNFHDKYYCRVFSGTLHSGNEVYPVNSESGVSIYVKEPVDEVPAGNLVHIDLEYDFEDRYFDVLCLKGSRISKLRSVYLEPESMFVGLTPMDCCPEHAFSMSVRPKNTNDYAKLRDFMNPGKRDCNVEFDFDAGDGNSLITSVSAALLNEIVNGLKRFFSIDLIVSGPHVIYRESILARSGPVEARSPNGQNAFSIEVEPLDECILNALNNGEINENDFKTPNRSSMHYDEIEVDTEKFAELGMDEAEANCIWDIKNRNMFLNMASDVKFMDESKMMLLDGFEEIVKEGPLASVEACGLKVKLVDAKLHEDPIHRGPAQVMPAVKKAINDAIMLAKPCLLEPIQKVFISAPKDCVDKCIQKIEDVHGTIVREEFFGDFCKIETEVPASEMFGFLEDINSAGESRLGAYPDKIVGFRRVPGDLEEIILKEIR